MNGAPKPPDNYDIIDKEEKDMQNYVKNLFTSDPSISRQIEDYLKVRKLQLEKQMRGSDAAPLTEQDYHDHDNHEEELREEDLDYEPE